MNKWKIVRLNAPRSILAKLAYSVCQYDNVQLVACDVMLHGKKCIHTALSRTLYAHTNANGIVTHAVYLIGLGYGSNLKEACLDTMKMWWFEKFNEKLSSAEEMLLVMTIRGILANV